jgi:REP-associated tyrosine transposase
MLTWHASGRVAAVDRGCFLTANADWDDTPAGATGLRWHCFGCPMFAHAGERGDFSGPSMPKNLKRYYGRGDLHFVTFSCYRRLPLLKSAGARHAVVRALEEVREKYNFLLVGYVVMPEHVHLLIGEPSCGTPSTALHGLKLRASKRLRGTERKRSPAQRASLSGGSAAALPQFWERRFHDFNVWSAAKRREKLEYMHRNPVARELVTDPADWLWSSYSSYSGSGTPLIEIDYVP